MNFVPNIFLSWLILLIFAITLVYLYLKVLRKIDKEKTKKNKSNWVYGVISVFAVICNMFFIVHFKQEKVYFQSLLNEPISIFILSFLPIIFAAYFGNYISTIYIGLISGITQAGFRAGNLLVIAYMVIAGILFRFLSHYVPMFLAKRNRRHPLTTAIWTLIMLYPIITIAVLLYEESAFVHRLGVSLASGFSQWFAIILPVTLAGFLLEIIVLIRKEKESALCYKNQNQKLFFIQIPILLFIGLLTTTMLWQYLYQKNHDQAVEKVSYIGERAVEEHSDFLDIGKSNIKLIQDEHFSTIEEIQNIDHVLAQIYHNYPYFQELVILSNQQILASYPQDHKTPELLLDDPFRQRLQLIQGTPIPYRVETIQSENELTLYLFYTSVPHTDWVFIGLASPENNRFFSTDTGIYNIFEEIVWELSDSIGGQIHSSSNENVSEQLRNHVVSLSAMTGNISRGLHTNLGQGYYYIKDTGNYQIAFKGIILAEEISKITYHQIIPFIFLELLLFPFLLLFFKFNRQSLRAQVESVSQEAFGKKHESQYKSYRDVNNPYLEQLRVEIQTNKREMNDQLDHERNSLKVVQSLSRATTVDDVVKVISENSNFSKMGSLRIVMNPDIANYLGYGRKTATFGIGTGLNKYAFLDRFLYSKMEAEQIRIISNCDKSKWLGNGYKKQLPGSLAVCALRYGGTYLGVVWIADQKAHRFRTENIQMLSFLANQISNSLSNLYNIRLKESHKKRVEFLIQSIPEPVFVLNRHLKLVLINSAGRRLKNVISPKVRIGMELPDFVVDKNLYNFLGQTLSSTVVVSQLSLANGNVYSANLVVASEPTGFQSDWLICTLHDITAFQEKDEIRSEFMEAVGQYMQTPLRMTAGYLAMLSMVGSLNQAQADYVNNIGQSVQKMDTFVNDLLDINRISAGIGLDFKVVFATDLIEEVIEDLIPLAKQRKVQIISDKIPRRLMSKFDVDEKLFCQALYNLVKTGIYNNQMAGEVEIQLHAEGETLLFIVRDTGVGISPIDLPHIFNRIQQPQSLKSENHSGGLALSLVKSIVDRHLGEVWAESELGKGSTFYIRIPRVHPK
ncbi:MAG: hypothetical protein K8R40_10840 [Anaerolineaceae bacterium]|nr:hypothetical protein [Anaerolineaceae bacterium]